MKRFTKALVSLILIMSMLFAMSGCFIKDLFGDDSDNRGDYGRDFRGDDYERGD